VTIDELIALPQYSLTQSEKEIVLLERLRALHEHHAGACAEYGTAMRRLHGDDPPVSSLAALPHLPVRLFKSHLLSSVPDEEVFRIMVSSGTTGDTVSRIVLDRATAARQSQALASIMTSVLGPSRLPMLIIDHKGVATSTGALSARGAGVLGMMNFGRKPTFALDGEMRLIDRVVQDFLAEHGGHPFLVFGFTFMVWQYLYRPLADTGVDMSQAVVIHSGGWKRLEEEAVDNEAFKERLRAGLGIRRVHNFYGMVEQVGSVFLEGEDGYLHPPNFADVIVRDPITWEEAPVGEAGVIQVLSALPESYPGHSILTEDLGVIHGVDDSTRGLAGKYFSVIGRVPKAELRGCSDTHAYDR
jgi:hypothetical protein